MPTTKSKTNNEDRYAPTTWGGEGSDLEMPSGQLALVRRPGVEALIAAGVLHSLDSLTPIVGNMLNKAEGKPEVSAEQIVKNPDQMDALLHTINRVVCHVVMKPEIVMPPNDITSRKDGVVYADNVGLEDRMFILNYAVGGTRDVEQFRAESKTSMGSLADVTEAGLSSK